MAEGTVTKLDIERNIITEGLKTPLKKGEFWYLIDSKWFKQWKKYVGFEYWDTGSVGEESANPGSIDNSPILKEDNTNLKDHLLEEIDHVLVPEDAWEKMLNWYGIVDGQSGIRRVVIEQGMFVKQCKIEVYLTELNLCQNGNLNESTTKQFSRVDTIGMVEKTMKELFEIPDNKEVRLWNKYMSNTYELLNKTDVTVQDVPLFQGQIIVIEQKNEDGTWPRQSKNKMISNNSIDNELYNSMPVNRPLNYGFPQNNYSTMSYNSNEKCAQPGICGLSNLGNTCFMNSALQCLSNVRDLTDYFISEEWQEELNVANPLGMKGEIATSYAELIRNIWSGKYSHTVPRNFKLAVGRFAPQFSGYQQHDSQELLAFLLDGLHEDLNRIKKKPYIELKDNDDHTDLEAAKEAWGIYLKRNDSVIVDTFHALLKSTLVCPECDKISITFDPFCYLSLPLPVKKERQIEIFLVPDDPMRKPRRFKLTVPKSGCISDLCEALSKLTSIAVDRMVVTDVYNRRFHKIFPMEENLSMIIDKDDIFIYEIPVSYDDPETLILNVYMREKVIKQDCNYTPHISSQLFSQPLLVPVPRKNCTYDKLYNCVLNKMKRYVRVPEEKDEWWKSTGSSDNQCNGYCSYDSNCKTETMNGDDDEVDSDETENCEMKISSEENGEVESNEDAENANKNEKPPRLFTFHFVNAYGSLDVHYFEDDGNYLSLDSRSYVAIDWHPKAKALFFDEASAEEFETDDSMNYRPVKRHIQLNECLELFTTTEKLGSNDPWYCPRCKKHQLATKKFDVWSLPKTLVIHLKRFSYNRYMREKIDAYVEFPTQGFNVSKFVIDPDHGSATYDLTGVVNHFGGMGGGHYTAFAKSKDGKFYNFDDAHVSATTEDSVVTKAAYVLVYELRLPQNKSTNSTSTIPSVEDSDITIENHINDFNNADEMEIN